MTNIRQAKRFAWRAIDPALTRSVLVAAYQEFGPAEAAAKVGGLSDEHFVRQAERALDCPPTAMIWDNHGHPRVGA